MLRRVVRNHGIGTGLDGKAIGCGQEIDLEMRHCGVGRKDHAVMWY